MARQRQPPVLASMFMAALLLAGLLPPGAAAGNTQLSVALWHDNAIGIKANQTLRVHAQVYAQANPVAPDNVTFGWGFASPALYAGVYDNATGLYLADINISAYDASIGGGYLQVVVWRANESAAAHTNVFFSLSSGSTSLWTIGASTSNLRETGEWIQPGERVNFTIATYSLGALADAPTLTADLFMDPDGTRTGEATRLTLGTGVGPGVRTASVVVPADLKESQVISLQLTVNESGWFYRTNYTLPVTMYDVLLDFSRLDSSRFAGTLIVGDGRDPVAGAKAELSVLANYYTEVGPINATTDAGGHASFNFPTGGYSYFLVDGWVNGSRHQRVSQTMSIRAAPQAPAAPAPTGFDAVPQAPTSGLPWSGSVSLPFRFYNNATPWANSPVFAILYGARGLIGSLTVSTNATGWATVSGNISRAPFALEDYGFGGVHFLFRAAVGLNNNSSDGFFWAEDDQPVAFNVNDALLSMFTSADVAVDVRPTSFGAPFGAAVKYSGPLDVSRWKGSAIVFLNGPDTFQRIFGTGDVAELTAGGFIATRNYGMKAGAPGEFFGVIDYPSYFPARNITVLTGLSDLDGAVLAGSNSTAIGVVTLAPGQEAAGFTPSAQALSPEVYASDVWTGSGDITRLLAHGYDDTVTFPEQWNWTWTVSLGTGSLTLYGFDPWATVTSTGDFPAAVTVRDGAGRSATASFTLHVLDITAPSVSAGPDRSFSGGAPVSFDAVVTDNDPNFATTGAVYWNFSYNGTNYSVAGAHLEFTFWRPGPIVLTAFGADAAGNLASDSMTATVLPPDTTAPQILGLGGNRTEPLGLPLRLQANVTDNDPLFATNLRANWTFVHLGQVTVVNGTTASYTFWQEGNITLRFTVEDFWGNSNSSEVNITFVAGFTLPPIPDAGENFTVMTGQRVDLKANATTDDPVFPAGANFTWTFLDGSTPVTLYNQFAFYAFRLEGAYTVTLTMTDRWGKGGTDTVQVVVIGPDTLPPLVSPISNKNIVVNTTLNFEPQVTDNSVVFSYTGNYSWTVEFEGQSTPLYGKRIVYNFTHVGIYNWTLVVRDGMLNPSEMVRFYVRVDLPDERPPLITASADSYSVAAGTTVQFHATATDRGENLTDDRIFNWTLKSGATVVHLTGASPFFKFEAPGDYEVTLRVSDLAGNVANASFNVHVSAPPPPGFLPGWSAAGAAAALAVVASAALLARRSHGRGPRAL